MGSLIVLSGSQNNIANMPTENQHNNNNVSGNNNIGNASALNAVTNDTNNNNSYLSTNGGIPLPNIRETMNDLNEDEGEEEPLPEPRRNTRPQGFNARLSQDLADTLTERASRASVDAVEPET